MHAGKAEKNINVSRLSLEIQKFNKEMHNNPINQMNG